MYHTLEPHMHWNQQAEINRCLPQYALQTLPISGVLELRLLWPSRLSEEPPWDSVVSFIGLFEVDP